MESTKTFGVRFYLTTRHQEFPRSSYLCKSQLQQKED